VALLPPDPVDLNIWIERALDQNPSIKLQEHAVQVADYEVKRQFAGHYPALDAVGHYKNEDTDGTVFGGGGEVDSYDVMVQLTLPLYQGGIVSSNVRIAKHKLNSARQDLTKSTRSVQRQTRAAFLGVDTALRKIDALQQSVSANQLALDAKKEGYLSGLFTSLNVLDAERDLSLVSIDYAKSRYRYVLNSLQLKQAVGSLTADDVLKLNQWFAAGGRRVVAPAFTDAMGVVEPLPLKTKSAKQRKTVSGSSGDAQATAGPLGVEAVELIKQDKKKIIRKV
jgi:outer membrane protein